MKLLLDTHVLLWWLADDPRLTKEAKNAISDPQNPVAVSAVSIWEIVIKKGLGKLEIDDNWFAIVSEEPFLHLPITWEHANKVADLPVLHRDPFDRLLIAQAMVEDFILVSHDDVLADYDLKVLKT